MSSRIFRYEVPVDDQWHRIEGCLAPLHVDCRQLDVVEFWAWEYTDTTVADEYRVIGTGKPIDDPIQYMGTAIAPGGHLVWHLVRRYA